MKISLTVGYAIVALLQLAGHSTGEPLSIAAMAPRTHLPERYLMLVMKSLKAAGLVHATRGKHGGFALAKPIGRIRFQEVMDAVEVPRSPLEWPANGFAPASQRLIDSTLADIANAERRRLSEFTLNELRLKKR